MSFNKVVKGQIKEAQKIGKAEIKKEVERVRAGIDLKEEDQPTAAESRAISKRFISRISRHVRNYPRPDSQYQCNCRHIPAYRPGRIETSSHW